MALLKFSRFIHPTTFRKKYLFNNMYINNQSVHSFQTNVNYKINNTVKHVMGYWHSRFKNEDIAEPLESIQHILSHVLDIEKRLELTKLCNKRLSQAQMKNLESLCLCRLSRMPTQYLIGRWTFRDIIIKLVPPVFIPRPETEILVDFVIEQILNRDTVENIPINILEIGCGSGAISLAILNSCKTRAKLHCIAVDTDPHACKLAKENAQALGYDDNFITIMNATIQENGHIVSAAGQPYIDFLRPQFDVIVSNPPYIPTQSIAELASEIKVYEDIKALDGGVDGLDIIKAIISFATVGLKRSGHLFMEIDPSQPRLIQSYVKEFAFMDLKYENTYKDYSNADRFVKISRIDSASR